MSKVQAVLFDNTKFTPTEARAWLKKHDKERLKRVHKTDNYLRYRLREPSKNKRYRTKQVTDGIKFVFEFS